MTSNPSIRIFPTVRPYLSFLLDSTVTCLSKSSAARDCLDCLLNACFLSGASIPISRILTCMLEASRTVTESPSEIPMTLPWRISASERRESSNTDARIRNLTVQNFIIGKPPFLVNRIAMILREIFDLLECDVL
uniref:Uncharacterized protein n=1 Tax=Candidatus Nitrotoga fabula TaxID=2182327 RepID=A0A2X0QVZ6_9PROT|nr:protein of unknown function [Candidatus Nitrotoga fabula]